MEDSTKPSKVYGPEELLTRFRETLKISTRQATFTCGGSLPIESTPRRDEAGNLTPRTGEKVQEQRILPRDVILRWGGDGDGRVLSLPLKGDDDSTLKALIQDCEPATFGRGGEDVYDEKYRLAGTMGVKDFMTDFCPYEAGIIDVVTQLLLPSVTGGDLKRTPSRDNITDADREARIYADIDDFTRPKDDHMQSAEVQSYLAKLGILPSTTEEKLQIMGLLDPEGTGTTAKKDLVKVAAERLVRQADENRENLAKAMKRGIRAELYKLNVYSGPSGMFKPHVDTPRSDVQIGSLVVCLPVNFEGGALAVRHQGQEVVRDWSAQASAIHWAAFYSDCEHEVLPVTAGHRITLTYNLFLAPGTSLLAGKPKSLQPASLPLTQRLKEMLESAAFMPKGGYLGIHLTHSYPHTHGNLHAFVPKMLKGVDMALYEAVISLGLPVALDQMAGANLPTDDTLAQLDAAAPPALVFNLAEIAFGEGEEEDPIDEYDPEEWFERRGWKRTSWGVERPSHLKDKMALRRRYWGEADEILLMEDRIRARQRITWLNEWMHEEMSRAFIAGLKYGNQAELTVTLSSAALVVKIRGWEERSAGVPSDTTSNLKVLAGGTTGLIKLRTQGSEVEKAPYPDSIDFHLSIRDLQQEYEAYQKLPQHPRLLRLHPDSHPERLVLPYLPNGCLHEFLRATSISTTQKLQFAADAAEGLQIVHRAGIIHGDINSVNFLLDDNFRLCIIDFAGSTVDGKAGSAFEGCRYCLPRPIDHPSTVRSDLFALGSLLYEISTGEEPYQESRDEEVVELFGKGVFPSTRELVLGRIVLGCWEGVYESARAVYEDVRKTAGEGQIHD